MLLATLPDWLDPDLLRWILLVVIAVTVYIMYVVLRFVRRTVTKVFLFALLAGFGLSLWIQRTDLEDCARVCECRLYGQEVEIPRSELLDDVKKRLDESGELCGDPATVDT